MDQILLYNNGIKSNLNTYDERCYLHYKMNGFNSF